jgi:hypothetical protein
MKTGLHLDEESERAYMLARECVLRARSRALFELLSTINGTASPSDVRVGLQAAGLVRESLRLPKNRRTYADVIDYAEIAGHREPA